MVRRPVLAALLGAAAVPPLVVGYLLALGYRPPEAGPPVAVLTVSLAAAGAVLVGGVAVGLRVAPALVTLSLGLAPLDPLFGPAAGGFQSATAFAADALFVAVCGALLASAEYAVRNRARLRETVERRHVELALLAGGAHAVLAVAVRSALLAAYGGVDFALAVWVGPSPFSWGAAVWMVGGAVLAGAVPAFLFVRHRLATPALFTAAAFAWAAWETWAYVRALDGAVMGAAFTSFTAYLLAWFLVVGVALVAAGGEYAARDALAA